MQGTRVRSLVGELSPRAATTIELARLNERDRVPETTEPTCSGAGAPQLERSLRTATKGPACLDEDPTCRN